MAEGEDGGHAGVERLPQVGGLKAQRLQAAGEDGLRDGCGRVQHSSDLTGRTRPGPAAVRRRVNFLWMPGGVFQGRRHHGMVEEDGRELSLVG